VRRAPKPACLVLALTLGLTAAHSQPASAQSPPPPPQAAKPGVALAPAEAERIFTDVLQRFFQSYAAKSIEGMAALWHPGGPARYRRNVVVVEFDTRQVAIGGLVVRNASADPGGGRARAILDLAVTDTKTGKSRNERRVRDFTFLPDDGGAWKIWNEVSPAGELARSVVAVPAAQREAFIASQPELASDDTLRGLSSEAGRLQGLGRESEVLEVLDTQARLARSLGDQDALGRSLVQSGSMRMRAGNYPAASADFGAAREAFTASGNDEEVAACDANLGNMAYMQGLFANAAERYDRAFAVFERLNADGRMASTLHGMANARFMQSDFSRALQYYTRAVEIYRRTKDTYGEASALQAMALAYKELGDYGPAGDVWRRAMVLTEAGGDRAGTAKAYAGLGEIYRLQGDLARALQHQIKALEMWEQLKNVGASATAHFAVGQVYALQRNFPKALDSYEKALALDRSIRDDVATSESGQARELGGMAGAHFATGQPDVALGEYERSLALREKLKDETGVMWTLAHMGVLHASQQRPDEALKVYERSLGIAGAKPDPNAVSTVLALRAQLEFEQGRDEAALATAAQASEIALGIEHFDTVMYARVVVGRVHQKSARWAEAQAAYEDAVAALANVPVGPAAETFFDNRRAPFVALVDLLASQGNANDAFRWSERARLESLSEMLGGDGAIVVKSLTVEERDLERSVAKDARALAVRIRRERGRPKPDADRLASLQAELAAKQSDRDALRRRIYEAHPELRQLRAQGEPAGPDAAAAAAGAAPAVVLSFVLTEARTWAFAVAKDAATGAWGVQKLVPIEVKAAELGLKVRQFREAIARKDARVEELGRELYQRLLDPLDPLLSKMTRLLVVPDGFLWSLPFEALPTPAGTFLVEEMAISYIPSLTAAAALAAAAPGVAGTRTLVTFGQPVIGPALEQRLALVRPAAPAAAAQAPVSPAPAAAPPAAPSSPAASAPAAAPRPPADPEVQAISSLFAPASRKIYVGDQARSDRLAPGVAPGTLLHLAVPLVLTEAAPLYSTLAFTPTDSADPSTGLVETYALMFVNLPAEVVVASRVEYGPASGEGEALTALAWMLIVGGSPTLVLDRWVVGASDPNVAVRFAQAHVAPSAGPARAPRAADSMQKAMKGILSQPATRHPYYWAGYLVIGR
jgi:tetratricopeptide (TPR) repeat protein/CHAT domain-containing protein